MRLEEPVTHLFCCGPRASASKSGASLPLEPTEGLNEARSGFGGAARFDLVLEELGTKNGAGRIPPEESMANTTKIEDKAERKAVKRAARKKAAPKAPRTGARGENKQKLKKASKGASKR